LNHTRIIYPVFCPIVNKKTTARLDFFTFFSFFCDKAADSHRPAALFFISAFQKK